MHNISFVATEKNEKILRTAGKDGIFLGLLKRIRTNWIDIETRYLIKTVTEGNTKWKNHKGIYDSSNLNYATPVFQ